MQVKTKQRLVGLLILLAIVAIFLPLLFHNSHPSTQVSAAVRVPPKPKMTTQPAKLQSLRAPKNEARVEPAVSQLPSSQPAPISVRPVPTPQVAKPLLREQKLTPKLTPHKKSSVKAAPRASAQLSKSQLKKVKARVTSEQKGLKEFISEPKAWAVQLGTFNNVENANRLIKKLREKGFDAYTRPVLDAKGNHLLRVYVGPEIRRESAIQLRNKLRAAFHIKGVVRKYNIKT